MKNKILKVIRYAKIYGITRSLVKVAGRKHIKIVLPNFKSKRTISIIGCGQFAFSTISYFLYFFRKGHFLGCYDIDNEKANNLGTFYRFSKVYSDTNTLFSDNACKLIYIASNHSSHAPYAVKALQNNIDVYIEKPIVVNFEQLVDLKEHIQSSTSRIFIGYNRPFSKAINIISKEINNIRKPISINCFISGHNIPVDHWYRKPEEGTRVCGNLGHWLDLTMYLFNKRGYIPIKYNISISYANINESDDNILVGFTTDFNDIVSILLSSRCEPFEGINETINIQCDNIIAKIDDFRRMTIWKDQIMKKFIFWPKDVGHKNAVLQPFSKESGRDFYEIEASTLLMLKIKDMVLGAVTQDNYNLLENYSELLIKVKEKNEANHTRP
jgi:predicted dehydrogenase